MWNGVITALIANLGSLIVVAALLVPAFITSWCFRARKPIRANPLTKDLIRPPGHSLARKIADLDFDQTGHLAMLFCLPAFAYGVHVTQSHYFAIPESSVRVVGLTLTVAVFCWLIGRRLAKNSSVIRRLQLALEGEQFVGEELNQLMLDGCRVFHDIPYLYGNIDHVVVSVSGVYAVNTKMHGKLLGDARDAKVVVDYSTATLKFPDRDIPLPKDQLEAEVRWLSEHLSSSTGFPVVAEPMLALPGWFIADRIGRQKGDPYVFNPTKPAKFFVQNRQLISPQQVKQIAHQLEQLCRDVELSSKDEVKRWEH
jgi:hypothetical protein